MFRSDRLKKSRIGEPSVCEIDPYTTNFGKRFPGVSAFVIDDVLVAEPSRRLATLRQGADHMLTNLQESNKRFALISDKKDPTYLTDLVHVVQAVLPDWQGKLHQQYGRCEDPYDPYVFHKAAELLQTPISRLGYLGLLHHHPSAIEAGVGVRIYPSK